MRTKYVLDNVVAVLILYELVGGRVELLKYALRLLGRAMFENALDDSAAVRMGAQRVHLAGKGADDKLKGTWLHALDALLYDMITILVFHALENVAIEFTHDLLLLLRSDRLQRFLNDSAAIHLQRERQYMSAYLYNYKFSCYFSRLNFEFTA